MGNDEEILDYVHKTRESGGNVDSQSKWQVDPKDIRIWVESSLKGEREKLEIKHKYQIVNAKTNKALTSFYSKNDMKAERHKKRLQDRLPKLRKSENNDPKLIRTNQTEQFIEKKQVKQPLVNEVGAYHILSIMEGVFSRIGTMSKLSQNDINNIVWEDVFVPLVNTIMENRDKYGIDKGSRDEIVSFVTSTSVLILKASHQGWARNKLSELTQERVITQRGDTSNRGGRNFPVN